MKIQVDPDWWKTLFDEVYLKTDARSVCDDDLTRREVDLICGLLPILPGHRVLDLCGGHGRHSLELAGRGFENCVVLDYSQYLIDHGRANAGRRGCRLEFVQGDARDIRLPEGSFDHVLIMGNSLGYLPEPEDDRKILQEAFRVLCGGAHLLVDVSDGEVAGKEMALEARHRIDRDLSVKRKRQIIGNVVVTREAVVSKKRGVIREQKYSIRIYDPEKMEEMVRRSGFENVRVSKGFSPLERAGDYGLMNKRVVITAQKPSS